MPIIQLRQRQLRDSVETRPVSTLCSRNCCSSSHTGLDWWANLGEYFSSDWQWQTADRREQEPSIQHGVTMATVVNLCEMQPAGDQYKVTIRCGISMTLLTHSYRLTTQPESVTSLPQTEPEEANRLFVRHQTTSERQRQERSSEGSNVKTRMAAKLVKFRRNTGVTRGVTL